MELRIDNMTCGGCVKSVTKAIQSIDATARVEADTDTRMVRVDTTATEEAVQQVLEKAGFSAIAGE